jgi:hypothetical protein
MKIGKKSIDFMFSKIGMVITLLAIYSIHIEIKPNEKEKHHKTLANQMEFQSRYVLQFPYSFTIYYINCVYLRVWVSRVILKNLDENQ